jgi:hypothetical protein
MLQPSNSFFYLAGNVLVIPALAAALRSVRRLSSFQQYFPAAERPAAAPFLVCLNT